MNSVRPIKLDALVAALAPYDTVDLLTAVAGLQLLPENAERSNRLIALAHAVASLPDITDKPKIDRRHLKRLCSARPLGHGTIAKSEDPYQNPFTEAFTFYGGSYTLFPGQHEEATFVLRHLAEALFLREDSFSDRTFVSEARDILLVSLALSDEVARRGSIDRNLAPASAPGPGVVLPDVERFQELQAAVVFDLPSLQKFLAGENIGTSGLDMLSIAQGSVSCASYHIDQGDLLRQPLVRSGDRLIVALPSLMADATRHAILRLALKRGMIDELAARYTEVVWGTVEEVLHYTNNLPTDWTSGRPEGISNSRHGLFHLDADKFLYVALVTDPLTGYQENEVFGEWRVGALVDALQERLDLTTRGIFSLTHPPSDILVLVLAQGVGRLFQGMFHRSSDSSDPELLPMSVADLETITFLERGDSLALWKYAQALKRAWDRGPLYAPTVLDLFAFYRMNHHSFFSPEIALSPPPVIVGLRPGGAGDLRWKALQDQDWHAAPSYIIGAATEVVAWHGTREIPIYAERGSMRHSLSLLVEALPLPIWVTVDRPLSSANGAGSRHGARRAAAGTATSDNRLYSIASDFVDAIAYWVWQCSPALQSMLSPLETSVARILLISTPSPKPSNRGESRSCGWCAVVK